MEKQIEWNEVWKTKELDVLEVKRKDRLIYILSDPRNDDCLSIEGKELIAFARALLETEESEER